MINSDTHQAQLLATRNGLRGKLLKRQKLITPSNLSLAGKPSLKVALTGLECCYCHEITPINTSNFDLHEIIYSRGDVQGMPKDMLLGIMHECNCGWIHRKCHQYAEGGEGRLRGIMYLLKYEGQSSVLEWCKTINEKVLDPHFVRDVSLVIEAMDKILQEGADVRYTKAIG